MLLFLNGSKPLCTTSSRKAFKKTGSCYESMIASMFLKLDCEQDTRLQGGQTLSLSDGAWLSVPIHLKGAQ